MSVTWKRSKKNQGPKAKARRGSAIQRLEEQLKVGKKPNKELSNPHLSGNDLLVDLTDSDKVRIKKEISTLKERV